MFEFNLPDLGEGIHEGEILKWYVAVGDIVEEDAPLVEVETDKAAVTIPSPKGGKVISVAGDVGMIVETGSVIVVIDDGSGGTVKVEETEDPVKKRRKRSIPANSAIPGRPVPAAPSTRRLARELGVDINSLNGTGPGGRVMPDDVKMSIDGDVVVLTPETNVASVASAIPFLDIEALPDYSLQGEVEVEPLRSIRRRVARKMTTSMILVPHVAHMDEADVTELEEFRKRVAPAHEKRGGGKLTLLSFVIRAVTAGLKEAPSFNASLDPLREELIYKKFYNIGFAADTGRGLVVPVINDTDKKSIGEISKDLQQKAELAREGKLPLDEMQGGTFTVTNVGPLGGTALIPTINYPEVAILGMGRVQEKPVVRNGEIVIRKMLPLTLAFDHRVSDGADAARFVSELIRWLSDPKQLLLDI
jgi:pyruvate dehydrogenase E2 component (dihydrolipoamide acetyltransferase)